MRGTYSYNESLFSTVRPEEFVPQTHPLRPIRTWMNEALSNMDANFSAMYEADTKGGRPSIAPEKLMLDAATDLFNATVETAHKRGLLSGEHFSVDGTLIHAWASHKSIRRKDGGSDDRPPDNWHGESRSNETHESQRDGESRLYRKSNAAPALPSYLGHVLTDNRHGLVANVQASEANGSHISGENTPIIRGQVNFRSVLGASPSEISLALRICPVPRRPPERTLPSD